MNTPPLNHRPDQRRRGARGTGDQSNSAAGRRALGDGSSGEASASHNGRIGTERGLQGTECGAEVTTFMGPDPWNRCCPCWHSSADRLATEMGVVLAFPKRRTETPTKGTAGPQIVSASEEAVITASN
jgi:hypothetical protein